MLTGPSTLNARAVGFAAGIVAATISALCAAALAVAPRATRALAGYLLHSDLSSVTPAVSWSSVVTSVIGWGLIAGVAFATAAALYNRSIAARTA